ncbi:tRNA pseudouridine(38-40) synthase TruA [Microlunatus sp. Gsoil 973]|uniref:tRNA pseudouridine synthase A n=1 Tax=Microlunatus sp. Gsoil 973 TaxID=2672569 RepID=UPI0012B48778|nr:tRNA pseudouridine synthase A [Microlunatus sp. Gsoil 973]QGN35782.1 tRNA pseudouridine(38-40) synthase TruA [Microlunatus sp. Gsoil 973]
MSAALTDAGPGRWRLDVSYRGTAFSGWAHQPGLRTVQGELELWLPRLLRVDHQLPLVVAGRTDAGVHARGQVCHFDCEPGVIADDGTTLLRRFARVLPDDLVVRRVQRAPEGFDARFSALRRRYVYRLADGPVPPDPLHRDHVARWPRPLDLQAMNTAAVGVLGLRDFAAFCKRREAATTIRTLIELSGRRVDHGPLAGVIEFTVVADAFCHSMVRSLVGALVRVGEGARDAEWLAGIAARGVRDSGIQVMPAAGLTLEQVDYPADDQLAARAVEARRTRELLGTTDD